MSRPGARRGGCSPPWNAASMSRDVAALRQHEPGRPAPRAPTLTGRASLNAVQSLLDYGAKLGVGLVVTPIVVTGLGRSLFGVWEMLNRLVTYMSAADGRPTEALRLIVSSRQAVDDDALQRRAVGAALLIWVLFLPLIAAVGAILIWIAPTITQVAPELRGGVRAVTALLLLSFFLILVAGVPESVLRGMNLGYRRMGLQASLNVLAGLLTVVAVRAGLGLVGLGGAQVGVAMVTGVLFWLLARRYVHWFGVARPARADVMPLLSMSAWLTVGEAVAKLLLACDVIILGWVVSPALVTTYVLTGYAARTAIGIHVFAAGAAMPGLGGLIGRGARDHRAGGAAPPPVRRGRTLYRPARRPRRAVRRLSPAGARLAGRPQRPPPLARAGPPRRRHRVAVRRRAVDRPASADIALGGLERGRGAHGRPGVRHRARRRAVGRGASSGPDTAAGAAARARLVMALPVLPLPPAPRLTERRPPPGRPPQPLPAARPQVQRVVRWALYAYICSIPFEMPGRS